MLKITLINIIILFNVFIAFSQLSKEDSLIVAKSDYIKLTDSVNGTIPLIAMRTTICYFLCNNQNPDDYYYNKKSKLAKMNTKNNGEIYCLEYFRIGAVKELTGDVVMFFNGAAGGKGDDFWICYNKELTKVLGWHSTE